MRIGFVGTGGIARAHAEALAGVDGAQIVAVTDAVPEAATAMAEKTGATVFPSAKAMAADAGLDAIYILVPPFARGDGERAAIEHGIPFFIEKPVGLDLGEMHELANEIRRTGLLTSVGYMNRYRSAVRMARHLLTEEPPVLAYGAWFGGTPGGTGSWWPDKSKSGGQFHEQVTHTVDLARYLLGDAEEVYAAAATGFVGNIPGYSMDDAMTVAVKFRNGAIANLMSSVSSNAGGGVFLNINSMNRNFKFSGWEHSLRLEQKGTEAEDFAGEPDIFRIEDAAFVNAVTTGDRSGIESDYADGVKSAEISLGANKSAATGRPVELGA